MIDLNPTKAVFGTGSLVGGAEVFPSATQGSIAKNTGANWYTPECLSMQWGSITGWSSNHTEVYLREGTYQMWGVAYRRIPSYNISGTITVAGTVVMLFGYGTTGNAWEYGSAEVIAGTEGTYMCKFAQGTVIGAEGTLSDGAVFFQRL